jgi:hypothetical protein
MEKGWSRDGFLFPAVFLILRQETLRGRGNRRDSNPFPSTPLTMAVPQRTLNWHSERSGWKRVGVATVSSSPQCFLAEYGAFSFQKDIEEPSRLQPFSIHSSHYGRPSEDTELAV